MVKKFLRAVVLFLVRRILTGFEERGFLGVAKRFCLEALLSELVSFETRKKEGI